MPQVMSVKGGGAQDRRGQEQEDLESWDVIYKAPCGLSLRNYEDVMLFLVATESCDILQVHMLLILFTLRSFGQ